MHDYSFIKIINNYLQIYPLSQPVDLIKIIYQSEFGCSHLKSETDDIKKAIAAEYISLGLEKNRSLPFQNDYEHLFFDISDSLTRIDLKALSGYICPHTLAGFVNFTSENHEPTRENFDLKIKYVYEAIKDNRLQCGFSSDQFSVCCDDFKNNGYKPVSHSDIYRQAYKPSYRVVDKRFKKLFEIFIQTDKLFERNKRTVIALDGPSGAGKSTAASMIAYVYDANLFHMDDFFLRPEQKTAQRLAMPGGNVDYERFEQEVLKPISSPDILSNYFTYRPYDCKTQSLKSPVYALHNRFNIVEGVYSMSDTLNKYYDLKVVLDIDEQTQKDRILKRNGERMAQRFFNEWIPLEKEYFKHCSIYSKADIICKI